MLSNPFFRWSEDSGVCFWLSGCEDQWERGRPRSGLWQAVSVSAHVGRLRAFMWVSIAVVCLALWRNLETEHRGCCLTYVHSMSLIGIGWWWIPLLRGILSLMWVKLFGFLFFLSQIIFSSYPIGGLVKADGLLLLNRPPLLSVCVCVQGIQTSLSCQCSQAGLREPESPRISW